MITKDIYGYVVANQILRGWESGFIYDGSHVSGHLTKGFLHTKLCAVSVI